MANIVVDATRTESVRTATTDPYTFSYTPTTTPRGIVLCAINGNSATDQISTVTYGGVSLTRIVRATDTTTEPGGAEIWWLGSGVPTGTQTVSVDLASATGDDIEFVVFALNFGGTASNVAVVDFDSASQNQANPSKVMSYNGRNSVTISAFYYGGSSLPTPNANMTHLHDNNFTNKVGSVDMQTTPGTTDFTCSYTAATDDVALAIASFTERIAQTVAHTGANLTLTGGSAHVTVVRKHTAANLALTAGSQRLANTRIHTAAHMTLTSGTHTPGKYLPVGHVASNLALAGGSAHVTVTRITSAGNLALAGGSAAKTVGRALTAGNLQLTGGAQHFARTWQASGANLQLQGGTHGTTYNPGGVDNTVTHVAGHLTVTAGTSHLTVVRHHVAPNLALAAGTDVLTLTRMSSSAHLSLLSGTHTVDRQGATHEVIFYTTDEAPAGGMSGMGRRDTPTLARNRW